MRNSILLALAGTSLILIAVLSIQPVYAGEGGGRSYVTQECYDVLCKIAIVNRTFVPDTLKAQPLADIVWVNTDNVRHLITSGSYSGIERPIVSTFINPGESFTFSSQKPGEYKYFCQIHPLMKGVIVLEGEIIPEFPSIAMLIAAGALAPLIAMTRLRKDTKMNASVS